MRMFLFSAVLVLFLHLPASITRAQTISSQKGLTTAVFSTQYGAIKVYLPDDIRPGDMISGSVIAEPFGGNAKQVEKNLAELKKYSVSIENTSQQAGENYSSFKWVVPASAQLSVTLNLHGSSSGISSHLNILVRQEQLKITSPPGCIIPTHLLAGSPARITGSFDGDFANTKCKHDGEPLQILAESPRQCIFLYPRNAAGQQTIIVNENGNDRCTAVVESVKMDVISGQLHLKKGEGTFLDVRISGLQKLTSAAVLTVNNLSGTVVSLQPANDVVMPLYPAFLQNGRFNYRFGIESIQTGNYDVRINLDLPEPGPQFKPADENTEKKNDTVPCPEERVTSAQAELDALKAELAGIDAAIAAAKKAAEDCSNVYKKKQEAGRVANEKFKKQEQRKKNWEKSGKDVPADVKTDYDDAKKEKEQAEKDAADQKKKCDEAQAKLKGLEDRKTALPALIKTQEALVNVLKTEAEKCKKEAEEKKRKEEEEKKKAADAAAAAETTAAAEAEARRSAVAHQRYLLQNIYSLGLINSKEFWDTKGLWDWLPERLAKPVGDLAEDKGNPSPIPIDIIPALAGIYQVVGMLLDPCTADGARKTVERLRKMVNTKTNSKYTEEEALTKTEQLCETLKAIKALAKAAGGK